MVGCFVQRPDSLRWPIAVHALLHPAGSSGYLFHKAKASSPTTIRNSLSSPTSLGSRGVNTWAFGGQLIETYDNYAQTNIASGAFAFNGSWTNSNAVSGGTGGISFADFLLGYGLKPVQRVQPQFR